MNRGTVYRVLNKFDDHGAAIKISNKGKDGSNNFYILGFEKRDSGEKLPQCLVDSAQLSSGEKIPVGVIEFIKQNYMDYMSLYGTRVTGSEKTLIKTLFPYQR